MVRTKDPGKPRDRSGRNRAGEKQKSGAQKLKDRGMTSQDAAYKRFKWGRMVRQK